MTAKIQRSCIREPIRDAIVSKILDGAYSPGTRLKELDLAREFQVSQAPIREALRELEALGLVETEHYRGTKVREFHLEDLREAYELRMLIEQASVRDAIPCREEDLDELQADIDIMDKAARRNDRNGFMDGAVHFHRKLVEMSGNRVFMQVWESMAWGVRARVAAKHLGIAGPFSELRNKLVAAMRKGDGDAAAKHARSITEFLLKRIREVSVVEAQQNRKKKSA